MIHTTAHDLAALESSLLQVSADITDLEARLHGAQATKAYLQSRRDTLRTQSQLPVIDWKAHTTKTKRPTAVSKKKAATPKLAPVATPTKHELLCEVLELILKVAGRPMYLHELVAQIVAERFSTDPPKLVKSTVHAVLNNAPDKFYKVSRGLYDLAAPQLVAVGGEGQHADSA